MWRGLPHFLPHYRVIFLPHKLTFLTNKLLEKLYSVVFAMLPDYREMVEHRGLEPLTS